MRQLKIALAIASAAILQSVLRGVWPPLGYADLPLILVVYYALRRELGTALIVAALVGLAADALGSGDLLGAGGFSKTLTAYLVVSLAIRVMVDNPLARIPVLAGAKAVCILIELGLHKMLGQPIPYQAAAQQIPWQLLATTVAGSLILLIIDNFFSERARQQRKVAIRRRGLRR